MENINEALGLLVVGMVMVLIILCLVVVVGNLVIMLTNRFIPEVRKSEEEGNGRQAHPKKMAAIVAAIDIITHGRGRVDSIQKK